MKCLAACLLLVLSLLNAKSQTSDSQPSISVQQLKLDSAHLLLDSKLKDKAHSPYAFSDFKEAVAHFSENTTLYVAPGVYWVDDPETPEVVVGENGKEPFGMVIKAKKLHFIGIDRNARNTVFASQRGQTQGAIGNFTMFDFWCDELVVENMTMGNYCNVDLDYPLDPSLSRKKRNEAITQAHVGYVHGKSLKAKNVRFISRLNLNPLNGAELSYYEDCHFECTDDAMNGTAIYRHCDIELYGQKPFWSTFGKGAMFIDCDFIVKSNNREMYFCKQGGPLTLIDCRYHAPSDSIYIGWTPYPQTWLRCYQQNFTLNGRPYTIGQRQPQNTVVLSHFNDTLPPYLSIHPREIIMQTSDTINGIKSISATENCQWRIQKGYEPFVRITPAEDGKILVTATNHTDEIAKFCIEGYTNDGRIGACQLTVKPSLLPPPVFIRKPQIKSAKETISDSTVLTVDYELDLDGHRDESIITWYRDSIPVRVSHTTPCRTYPLTAADTGHTLTVQIQPKTNRSKPGLTESTYLDIPCDKPSNAISPRQKTLVEDFSTFPCDWQPHILPGFWTVDGYKPKDTEEFNWTFDNKRPMWEYGQGFNGAVGMGLLQAQRGARLMYTPLKGTYGDMTVTLEVDPTKTAGQGFGSATGQYMDVCLKFDPFTLTGYGLRIIRTTKHAKAVDFLLVAYQNGQTKAISEPISSTCYRTGCTITVSAHHNLLNAHIETKTPKPTDSQLPHIVDLSAEITPNAFGGIAIQHTGSCGESTTMLHRLSVDWK